MCILVGKIYLIKCLIFFNTLYMKYYIDLDNTMNLSKRSVG